MKTSKKLLSLLLVAIMLVSAIPFQALAAGGFDVTIGVDPTNSQNYGTPAVYGPYETLSYDQIAALAGINLDEVEALIRYDMGESRDVIVNAGDVITLTDVCKLWIDTTPKAEPPVVTPPAEEPPVEEPPVEEPVVEKFLVTVGLDAAGTHNNYEHKFDGEFEKNDTISYAQILTWAGVNAADVASIEVRFDMGGSEYTLTSGNHITLTAMCQIWVDTTPKAEPTPPAEEEPPVETPPAEGYTLTIDLAGAMGGRNFNSKITGVYEGYKGIFGQLEDRERHIMNYGHKLVGWKFSKTGTAITEEYTYDPADGTKIVAVWEYKMTLDFNRTDSTQWNRSVSIKVGDNILEKIKHVFVPQISGYVFVGWKLNGEFVKPGDTYKYNGDTTLYAEWKKIGSGFASGKVYLEIYLNGKPGELAKRVDITSYAADHMITRSEVEQIVKKYYSPKAGYQLKLEGLYDEESWWYYVRDQRTESEPYILVNHLSDEYVFVMVKNAKVAVADSSNPKTGDYILTTALSLMAVSGLAAAAVYVTGKKRKV